MGFLAEKLANLSISPWKISLECTWADPESFVRPLTMFFCFVFLVDGMERGKSGPSSARQRNAIEMAFPWRVDNGPPLNAGLVVL